MDLVEYFESNFKLAYKNEARRIIDLHPISFSFCKGNPEVHLIISGIINMTKYYEVRFTLKKSMELGYTLNSNCNCAQWTQEDHCSHVAALVLKYTKDFYKNKDETFLNTSLVSISEASKPEKYSTVIKSLQELNKYNRIQGYSNINFVLTNNKVVDFGVPKPFHGSLIVNLVFTKVEFDFEVEVYHKISDEVIVKEVSVLEYLYLFNWNNGFVYNLTLELKEFFRRLNLENFPSSFEEFYLITKKQFLSNIIELRINNEPVESYKKEPTHPQVNIVSLNKKNSFEFALSFNNLEKNKVNIPEILLLFIFENGLLDTLKKKTDSADFLKSVLSQTITDKNSFAALTRNSQNPKKINFYLEHYLTSDTYYSFNPYQDTLLEHDLVLLRLIMQKIYKHFGENFFKVSEYDHLEQRLVFKLAGANFIDSLNLIFMELAPFGVEFFYDNKKINNWANKIRFERHNLSESWFDLTLNLSEEDYEVLKNIDPNLRYAHTKEGLVLLNDNQSLLLKFIKKYTKYEKDKIEEDSNNNLKFHLSFKRARIFELFELRKLGIEGALLPDEIQLCEKLMNLDALPTYALPASLKGNPRPYQIVGYNWLNFLWENKLGACLADDMGLGKTLQTIMFFQNIIHKVNRILIVCPVSLILNWQNEITKFSDLEVDIYYGGQRKFNANSKILLTSYGIMKKEIEDNLKDLHFDILVMDEVQNLKNVKSLGAIAARNIKTNFRICMTGTPVENDISEFFNILDLSVPGIWGESSFIQTTSLAKKRLMAKNMAKPFILRRTKGQVLDDLPPKIENLVFLDFSQEEKLQYSHHLTHIKTKIEQSTPQKRYGEILKGLLELRQLCLWQKHHHHVTSTKIAFLLENLEQILEEGHQVLVFSQFTTYLDLIQKEFDLKTWKYCRIDGSQNFHKRQEHVDRFQSGKVQLFLISLKAGGVGLNLTAASYIFFMDPWWNPAVENQAIDRAHRIGQKNTLTVYRPFIKYSIEEKVLKLQEYKKELFRELLPENDDAYFSGKLSKNDFEFLFSE